MLRGAIFYLMACLLFAFSAATAWAAAPSKNTGHHIQTTRSHIVHNSKRMFLVPPPPPYVPTLLPELTYSRYYGHSPYGNSHISTSPRLFKPNKYVTYCL